MKQTLTEILLQALNRAREKGELKFETQPAIILDTPRDKTHGDLATTLALILAKPESKPPRKIAEIITRNISDAEGVIEKTEIAGRQGREGSRRIRERQPHGAAPRGPRKGRGNR